jgi:hypothetical protein
MGESGYVQAHAELNEQTHVKQFALMIETTVSPPN